MHHNCDTQIMVMHTFWQGVFGKKMWLEADAKCQTHIADNDFFPVHRQLVKDGILLYLQKYKQTIEPLKSKS